MLFLLSLLISLLRPLLIKKKLPDPKLSTSPLKSQQRLIDSEVFWDSIFVVPPANQGYIVSCYWLCFVFYRSRMFSHTHLQLRCWFKNLERSANKHICQTNYIETNGNAYRLLSAGILHQLQDTSALHYMCSSSLCWNFSVFCPPFLQHHIFLKFPSFIFRNNKARHSLFTLI